MDEHNTAHPPYTAADERLKVVARIKEQDHRLEMNQGCINFILPRADGLRLASQIGVALYQTIQNDARHVDMISASAPRKAGDVVAAAT